MDSTYNLYVHIVECHHNAVQFTRYYNWYCNDRNITTDTPHLTLMGELWGVTCEDLGENWPRKHAGNTIRQIQLLKKRHEYWQYLKKNNTDIIINKIWQKEQETQLGLWAPSLVQRMINHKQITSDVTYPTYKGWGLFLVGYFPMLYTFVFLCDGQ